jgi:uncharacterized protein (TIGR02231 family)
MTRPLRSPFRPLAAGLLLLGGALPAAWAQAPEGSGSRISAVTVYPGSATVERVLRVPAGARQATLACLPAGLDTASLQVDSDPAIRVGELAVRQQPRELLGKACASPLDERIRALEDQIAGLNAESAAIGYAVGYFKSFEHTASGGQAQAPVAPSQIAATAQALRQQGLGALTRQHQIGRQQELLNQELKPLLAERDRAGGKGALVSSVQVTLAAAQGGELRLRYQVRGPGWQPTYRAALDSRGGRVRLERLALVAQATGEDWDGVQLTLSTGQPGARTQGPLPQAWRVGIVPPAPPEAARERRMMAAAPAPVALAADAAGGAPLFDVGAVDGRFATEFRVAQRISVPSSGQRVALTLGEQTLEAQLRTRTVPAQDASAYLIAELTPPAGVWPAGPVQLLRDGAFVGNGRLDVAQLPRQGLSFGRDELVAVRMERPEQQQGTGGFIGNRNERRDQRVFVIENRHRDPIELQVLDAAPVSEHQDVRIESRYDPPPQDPAWNRQPGTVLWQQPLAAGATQRITAEHLISWPKDAQLREHR